MSIIEQAKEIFGFKPSTKFKEGQKQFLQQQLAFAEKMLQRWNIDREEAQRSYEYWKALYTRERDAQNPVANWNARLEYLEAAYAQWVERVEHEISRVNSEIAYLKREIEKLSRSDVTWNELVTPSVERE